MKKFIIILFIIFNFVSISYAGNNPVDMNKQLLLDRILSLKMQVEYYQVKFTDALKEYNKAIEQYDKLIEKRINKESDKEAEE